MHTLKRVSAFFLAMVMMISMMATTAFAADEPSIQVSTATAQPGQTVDVVVSLANNPGIVNITLKVAYDSNVMTLESVTDSKVFPGAMHSNKYTANPYTLTWANDTTATENITVNGDLVTLTFAVKEDAAFESYPITISSYEIRNFDLGKVDFETVAGGVTVVEGDPIEGYTFEDKTVTYGDAFTMEVKNMPEGVTAAYTYNGEETVPTDAGTYEVKATMTGEGWATEIATATLVIEQKGLTVSGLTAEKVYDGSNVISGELVNGKLEGTVNGDEITPVFPDLTLDSKDAGTYTVACNVELAGDKAANYVLANEAQTLTAKVKPLAVEVTTGNYTKAVGQADPEFVPVFTPELIAGDTYEGALSRKTGEKVNTSYQITKGDLKLNSNYTLTFGELGKLSIVDKVITKVEQISAPSKLSYVEGEKFDVTGMQVKVTYDNNDEDTAIVDKGFTVDPAFAKRALTTEDNGKKVTVTYNGQPFEFEISVEAKQLTGIELGSKTKTNYYVGNKVNPDKIVVVASYSNADPEEVKGFTLDIDSDYALTLEDNGKVINVSYTYNNVTKTVPMTISVSEVPAGGGGGASASYTIEVTAGEHGQITNAKGKVVEQVKVREGDDVTLTITPDKGYAIADVVVNGKSVGAVSTYTFKEVEDDATISATFVKAENTFIDVKPGDWFYNAVYTVYNKGLMNGTSANTFEPKANLTRGMIAQILYSLEGYPTVKGNAFSDVAANQWYANAVNWAYQNKIVAGYGEGKFGPEDPVTREQLAAILYTYAQFKEYPVAANGDLSNFTDRANASEWAENALIWAVDQKIISGKGEGILDAKGTATRAEVAQMLVSFLNVYGE